MSTFQLETLTELYWRQTRSEGYINVSDAVWREILCPLVALQTFVYKGVEMHELLSALRPEEGRLVLCPSLTRLHIFSTSRSREAGWSSGVPKVAVDCFSSRKERGAALWVVRVECSRKVFGLTTAAKLEEAVTNVEFDGDDDSGYE